ncbi:unnamed protein product [Cochlearia groenlandica]
MKTLMICLLVISSVMLAKSAEVASGGKKYLDPGVLDPCLRPNPPAGCQRDAKDKPRERANEYQRGCSNQQRCRT